MNSKQFLKRVLKSVREGFPDLYAKQIRGRRAAFMCENAPKEIKGEVEGKIVGRFSNDMKMLWALANFLREGPPRFLESSCFTPREFCQNAQIANKWISSAAISGCLRHIVVARHYPCPSDMVLRVNHDWSVVQVQCHGASMDDDGVIDLLALVVDGAALSHHCIEGAMIQIL